ncbi:MAG: hypothetical protein HY675_28550 [Chloroflexi bacterium]|nr:hypothetical protein [Chloroflexota bacterium]
MSQGIIRASRKTVTLVLRIWPEGMEPGVLGGLRYEALHVQSGEVLYFRDAQALAQYIKDLGARIFAA